MKGFDKASIKRGLTELLIEYETPRVVKVHNVGLGLVVKISQIMVLIYVATYAIWYERGYQEFASVEASVTVKVKGISHSRVTLTAENSSLLPEPWVHLYNRIWDEADYVVPPAENGAFFITTNIILTPNQTLSTCPESPESRGAECQTDADCPAGKYLPKGHGPLTGECVPSDRDSIRVCKVEAWCPIERDDVRLVGTEDTPHTLMDRAHEYTVFVKNSIAFPHYGTEYRRNNIIPGPAPSFYHPTENPYGQIFTLGDMVSMAGANFSDLSVKGAVLTLAIRWNCDLDHGMEHCTPEYKFRLLDEGWNFRHAYFHENERRTLMKVYGLRFVITVEGEGSKFSLRNLILNLGNGLALLGITTVVGEFFLMHFTKEKDNVQQKKYDYISQRRGRNNLENGDLAEDVGTIEEGQAEGGAELKEATKIRKVHYMPTPVQSESE